MYDLAMAGFCKWQPSSASARSAMNCPHSCSGATDADIMGDLCKGKDRCMADEFTQAGQCPGPHTSDGRAFYNRHHKPKSGTIN
jgi:hypothetical protein